MRSQTPLLPGLILIGVSLLIMGCQSSPRPHDEADSDPAFQEAPCEVAKLAPAQPPAEFEQSTPKPDASLLSTEEAELARDREHHRDRLRADRYAAAIERAQSEDLAGQPVSAVRSYRDALAIAPNGQARQEIELRVRSLMLEALQREQARERQSRDFSDFDARTRAVPDSGDSPGNPVDALAALPPLPDYRGLSEAQLDQLCVDSGPAARIHKAMGGASSFIAQAQALLGPGLSAQTLAHERYEAFKAGEALLASHQSLRRELDERLVFPEFRRWDQAWRLGAQAQGQEQPRRIERIQLLERAGQLCDELVASLRFLTWTNVSIQDRFGGFSQGRQLLTRSPNQAEQRALRAHCVELVEQALRQRRGQGMTILEAQFREMDLVAREALNLAARRQHRLELCDLLAALSGTARP